MPAIGPKSDIIICVSEVFSDILWQVLNITFSPKIFMKLPDDIEIMFFVGLGIEVTGESGAASIINFRPAHAVNANSLFEKFAVFDSNIQSGDICSRLFADFSSFRGRISGFVNDAEQANRLSPRKQ